MTLWGLPARRSPVRCFLWNLIAILAGGARRGQSRTPPLSPWCRRIDGAAGRQEPPSFPYSIALFADRRDSGCSNLTNISCCFRPLGNSGASPPRKLCTVSGTSTDGGWNAGRGYRNGNCRQCGSLDLVEALSGNGLRSRTSTRRTQPHRQHRLQRLQRSRSRRAGRACAFTRNAGQRSTTST